METSKKLLLLFASIVILPYSFFWAYSGFDVVLLGFVVLLLLLSLIFSAVVLKEELSGLRKLVDFAKALKDERWSTRVVGVHASCFEELTEAFNMAAERFERKQAELRQIIDLIPGFIYAKDDRGTILLANRCLSSYLGRQPWEIVGESENKFEGISFLSSDNGQRNDRVISEEVCYKDGIKSTYLVYKTPLLSKDGNKLANLVFAYDISDQKEIQKNLEILNNSLEERVAQEVDKNIQKDKELIKEKEKFIRNAVHEINSALTVITLNAEYLIKENGKSRSTSAILGAAKSLSSAYGDLSYSTIKDSPTFQKESSIDVSELIRLRVEFFLDIAGLSDITIKTGIEDGAVFVINEAKLTRLIDNNLSNAIKYSHPQKEVTVNFFCQDGVWWLEFYSEGKRIENKDKIFELYMREDGIKGGHGVGLSMVKEICDEYGIKIDVETFENKNIFRYRFEKN